MLDKLNDIQRKTDFTAEKIVKLEKEIDDIGNVLVLNYIFTVIVIPASVILTR
jgi:hypothetical protein